VVAAAGPAPSTWEVLRVLDRLEESISAKFEEINTRLDGADHRFYSRDYLDGQAAGIAARLAGFDQRHAEDARTRDRRRFMLWTAATVQAFATAGSLAAVLTYHHI
jgi:hypothetical protein